MRKLLAVALLSAGCSQSPDDGVRWFDQDRAVEDQRYGNILFVNQGDSVRIIREDADGHLLVRILDGPAAGHNTYVSQSLLRRR